MRSATAYEIYKDDDRFEIDSAGTDKLAAKVISIHQIEWADTIIVMEKHHRNEIRKHFPDLYQSKRIVCLYIPDEFDFMDNYLIELIKAKFEDLLRRGLA
jgi:predicted protein tyrosine phosphatase